MGPDNESPTRIEDGIKAVADGRSDTLDLSWNRHYGLLRELPSAVRHLGNLRTLRLTDSGLAELPGWLSDLPRLETVDVRGCPLAAIPPMPWVRWALDVGTFESHGAMIDPARVYGVAVGPGEDLRAAEQLIRFDRLSLTELSVGIPPWSPVPTWDDPQRVGRLLDRIITDSPRLRVLTVEGCPLGQVPAVRVSRDLQKLRLSGVLPGSVPYWLFDLPALTALDLSANELSELPAALQRASGLTRLDLGFNRFRAIPDGVWHLAGLTVLVLGNCPIEQIPADILRLTALEVLEVDPTSPELVVPPPEVTARGLTAIRSYWQQEQASGMDFLAEAKLLIVGEAGAGKTSLAKKILDAGYPLDPQESSTHGIGVSAWHFPSAVRISDPDGERMLPRDFRVNIWDFGGQEIYHSTHQFFLTRRSVYVLVCDERREDTDFRYWLDVLNLLSDGSPLVVVQNRKQGRGQDLDVRALRQEYPNLVATLGVNLSDNSGLTELMARLRRELELLPHIGTALPKTWQEVRLALERDERDHISADEFFRICAANGFRHTDDMRQLSGFLHDLGTCLHFQDDELLDKTVILKPEWGTGAVYRVLDDERIIANRGVFGPDDLRRIWREPAYASMRADLVRLMVKFSLCFPVPGTDHHIAPQLLSPVRPDHRWDEADDLALRYEYDVMPKGIVQRLIVELHDLIEDGAVWRSGVVLRHQAGRAEVVEDYHRRRLHIRLAARDPRLMLAVIDRALGRIHGSYRDLRVDRLRPCHCDACAAADEPTMFSVRELEDFARTGDHIQCRISRRLVDAAALLSELWQPGGADDARRATGAVEVFLSYKSGGAADALADELESALVGRGVLVRRDRNEMRYRDSIQRFMRRLGASRFVVVVLNDAFLKSKHCMFELTEVAERGDLATSIFPVVLADADIADPVGRLGYVKYWEAKRAELDRAMREVGQENLHGIREDLDLYDRIRTMVAGITEVLTDMNTLTPRGHLETDFAALHRALDTALNAAQPR